MAIDDIMTDDKRDQAEQELRDAVRELLQLGYTRQQIQLEVDIMVDEFEDR